MTDQAIARRGLEALGLPVTPQAVSALLAEYVRHLEAEVQATPVETYFVHPGMREAVLAAKAAGFAVGLGTGNVREGARIKLQRVQLFEPFDFGGFGDDHEARPELIRIGARRGLERLGVSDARVVVIGDTPLDVHAAKAIGAQCLAVTTGGVEAAALRAAGADWVVSSLAEPGALERLLTS